MRWKMMETVGCGPAIVESARRRSRPLWQNSPFELFCLHLTSVSKQPDAETGLCRCPHQAVGSMHRPLCVGYSRRIVAGPQRFACSREGCLQWVERVVRCPSNLLCRGGQIDLFPGQVENIGFARPTTRGFVPLSIES